MFDKCQIFCCRFAGDGFLKDAYHFAIHFDGDNFFCALSELVREYAEPRADFYDGVLIAYLCGFDNLTEDVFAYEEVLAEAFFC